MKENLVKGILDGLEELNDADSAAQTADIKMIEMDKIVPSPKNMYRIEDIEKLADSIKEGTLLHNLVVREMSNGTYEIISGERRFHALKLLNETKAPCKVVEANDTDAEIMLIKANSETRQLNDMEKAVQARRLIELYKDKKSRGEKIPGKIREIVGKDMNLSGVQVQRYDKLNDLIPELKNMLENKKITMVNAYSFAKMKPEEQKEIYHKLINHENISIEKSQKNQNADKPIHKTEKNTEDKTEVNDEDISPDDTSESAVNNIMSKIETEKNELNDMENNTINNIITDIETSLNNLRNKTISGQNLNKLIQIKISVNNLLNIE